MNDIVPAERAALAAPAGMPTRNAKSMLLDIGVVNAALVNAELAPSLKAALEMLDGPIIDRAAERAQEQAGGQGTAGPT